MKLTRLVDVPAAVRAAAAEIAAKPLAQRIMLQLSRISAWISQGINCLIFFGHHDQTLSARAYVGYRLRGVKAWSIPYYVLNWLFFWQVDHCMASHSEDEAFAQEIISARAREAPQAVENA